MSLNQGIHKYRESARVSTSKKQASAKEKEKESEKKEKKTAAAAPAKAATKAPKSKEPKEVQKAVEAVVAAEKSTQEEETLQKELEQELVADAAQTNLLVKEDFSPVNSTRDKLIVEYAPLIKYIAQKIAARLPANIELDDLISSGVIGLMDAIEKYDSSRDNKFKTYAEFRIRGAILDELRAQDWVPRSVREKAKQLERAFSKIEQSKGRQATDEEVCEELGLSQEDYHDMLNQVRSVSLLSYDEILSFSRSDRRTLHGIGESGSKAPTPFNEVNIAGIKRIIAEAIQDLPEKQRLVLSLYYYEDLNLKEIGKVLDVTESRVSQLHTQAILRLKAKLRNHWDEFVTLFG
ncbi:FliA/WhiG family RNA polymerase sigma factor [bacterium]|jgi:RNA polymerase sigma factor for flagellar operon FliA|nr:FliA/WhiG family RNA polymerase sigma factor [bacterium]